MPSDHEHTWTDGGDAPAQAAPALARRYRDVARIAMGGMSEIRRVWDTALGFHAAMKLLRPELLDNDRARARFDAEAALTARMQHPGIVAVYARGATPAGQPWFTMTEVRGKTLGEVIRQAHDEGMTSEALRRLVGLLLRACEAVAYAHSQGIIHRDLKPDNIMIGPFGEVLVMDWGLARALDSPEEAPDIARDFLAPDPNLTRAGDVLGTPAYMPPEQARGQLDQLGPAADVYALGAVLYEVLTGAPAAKGSARQVWRQLLAGPPTLFEDTDPDTIPPALEAICTEAMEAEPQHRYPDATALSAEIREWLDGARRRAQALAILEKAAALRPEIDALRQRARGDRAKAAAILAPLMPHSPVEKKGPAWDLEDAAEEAERAAVLKELQWQQIVGTALQQVPDLPEAHALLADHYAERLLDVEQEGRRAEVARYESLLANHDRGKHAKLLTGVGAVTLVTDPPGAEVRLFRYVEKRRQLVEEPRGVLGRTPLIRVPLEQGSWMLTLHLPGHHAVRYPIYLGRGESWDGIRPGGHEPYPIKLPRLGELYAGECYVPAGWFVAGGDPMAIDSLPRKKVWVDSFCIDRFPVTNSGYLDFLQSNKNQLNPLWTQPKHWVRSIQQSNDGTFELVDSQRSDWPVSLVSWHAASDCLSWRGRRLPHSLEWEKAARGVDGRICAWGDHLEFAWANIVDSKRGKPSPVPVDTYPFDTSPYGVRGTVGNTRDWCGNVWKKAGPQLHQGRLPPPETEQPGLVDAYYTSRGGAWSATIRLSRAALRYADVPESRFASLGFRGARALR